MNKLREEILLKIEEMGLLLSKEVRDRVTEERMLRKQSMTDFDTKIRDFMKNHGQQQRMETNKVRLFHSVVIVGEVALAISN